MSTIYKKIVKPTLFRFDPEFVHDRFISTGQLLGSNPFTRKAVELFYRHTDPILNTTVSGINFENPIGLSAGFDKDARIIKTTQAIGFGFQQVGSVTAHPYEGNPGKRLYRLPKTEGIVVYYGLKNDGAETICKRVKSAESVIGDYPLSISVAKTNSPNTCTTSEAIDDYLKTLEIFETIDTHKFYTINISCPNTYGGEPFTTPEKLQPLLKEIQSMKIARPIYIKMPVDMPYEELKVLADIAINYNVNGLIISNLTKDRDTPMILDHIPDSIKGGISGKPTSALSTNLIRKTYADFGNDLTLVGVGGVFNAVDAYEKILAGASLIQLITGMIFSGPGTIHKINKDLATLLRRDGFSSIAEAVGQAGRV